MNARALAENIDHRQHSEFEGFYGMYYKLIFSIVLRRVSEVAVAEEVVANSFLAAFESFEIVKSKKSPKAHLVKTAINQSNDFLRRKYKIKFEVLDHTVVDDKPAPEESYVENENRELIKEVLGRLDPLHAALLELKYLGDYSMAEIAIKLNMSEDQVKSLLHNARGIVKREYSDRFLDL